MKNIYRILLFIAVFMLFASFGQQLPITDPVESNYVLTAKEMLAANSWLSPQIYGHVWFDKPAMVYWMLNLSFTLFGVNEWAARLVPALFGAGGVALMEWFVSQVATPRQGLLAAGLLATSFQYFLLSKLLITDMILFVFANGAVALFYLSYTRRDKTRYRYLGMYLCMALAVLTKGPVGLVLPALIIVLFLAWERNWSEYKELRLFSGGLFFLAVVLPWYGYMFFAYGDAFWNAFFGVNNYLRATVSEHPKGDVFYYYIVIFLVSTLPWNGLALGGLYTGLKKLGKDSLYTLLTLWALLYLIVYSCMATKYPTYTFPLLFPVVILAVLYVTERSIKNSAACILAPFALAFAVFLGASYPFTSLTAFSGLVAVSLALIGYTWWRGQRRGSRAMVWAGCAGMLCFYFLVSVLVLPDAARERSGKELAELLRPYAGYTIGTYQFYSTSAVFYSGNLLVKMQSPEQDKPSQTGLNWSLKYTMPESTLPELYKQAGPVLVVVTTDKTNDFEQEAKGYTYAKVGASEEYCLYKLEK
ncbi:ArnT family glycosyltransferase [Propionispora hippei]|nr:glycosyltransferase family 39 protein [Propionispora hippei]